MDYYTEVVWTELGHSQMADPHSKIKKIIHQIKGILT